MLAVGTAALLAACGTQDADRDDVVNAVEEAGGDRAVANCIADAFVDRFDQEQLNDLGSADSVDDFPDGIRDEAETIMQSCFDSGGDSPGSESESGESTESTEATDAEESTTTTAAS